MTPSSAHLPLSQPGVSGALAPKTLNASEYVQATPSFRVFRRTMKVPFRNTNKFPVAKSISRNGLVHIGGRMPLWWKTTFKYLSAKIRFPAVHLDVKEHHRHDRVSLSLFIFCPGTCYVLLLYGALLKQMEKTGKNAVPLISIPSFQPFATSSSRSAFCNQSVHAAGHVALVI